MGNTIGDLNAAGAMSISDLLLIEQSGNSRKISLQNMFGGAAVGSFTPALEGSTGNPTPTFSYNVGKYFTVGELVWVFVGMGVSSYTGGSGNIRIGDLPYTASSFAALSFPMALGLVNKLDYLDGVVAKVIYSTDYIEFAEIPSTTTGTAATMTYADLGTNPSFELSGWYVRA